jgi:predicted adenine nucleotide alpha hydrolase (AANH) superfamily ATPase
MFMKPKNKPKLLLHTCCAPCAPHVIETLRKEFDVSIFFYNPNIHPFEEYQLRLEEMERYLDVLSVELIVGEYDAEQWFSAVLGMEHEQEGGRRCELCYRMRLDKTVSVARTQGFQQVTTTLTVSPHKKTTIINRIGRELTSTGDVTFYEADFKKRDGFKKSCELSKKLGFYRQNYCGCVYSKPR